MNSLKVIHRARIRSRAPLPLLLAVCTSLIGCGLGQSKKDASQVITAHFLALSTNGFDAALSGYSEEFYNHTPRDQWSKALPRLVNKVGVYQNHTVTGWRVFSGIGALGRGTTVVLKCQVHYSKSSLEETFTLFKGASDHDYKIVGHHIDGVALLAN